MSAARVAVVGGGLAGLSAAFACADAGARVSLFERLPRLGGATWSFPRDGLELDNGQHVFLRCCIRYLAFLSRIGARDRVALQRRLAVPVLSPGRPVAWIRRLALPAPVHLAPALLRFPHLGLGERLRAARAAHAFRQLDPDDPALDRIRLGDWLAARGQSERAIDRLWDLLMRATLNLPARDASLALAARVMRTGLLDSAEGGDLGWSRVPLSRLHAEPAAAALRCAGVRVALRAPVRELAPASDAPAWLRVGGERLEFDAIVVALAPRPAAALLRGQGGVDERLVRRLGRSPIVNLHLVYDRRVLPLPFAAGLDSPVQWIFDRTQGSGLERGQYLCVSQSAARAEEGRGRAELRARFEPALRELLPAARGARLTGFHVSCERDATTWQGPGTRALRPAPGRIAPGLHLAGAWTDTGWPATMEGAVRSGEAASRSALSAPGESRPRLAKSA